MKTCQNYKYDIDVGKYCAGLILHVCQRVNPQTFILQNRIKVQKWSWNQSRLLLTLPSGRTN